MTSRTGSIQNSGSSAAQKLDWLKNFVKQHGGTLILIATIILIILAACLVYLLANETFKSVFTCQHLIDAPLGLDDKSTPTSLCEGAAINIPKEVVTVIPRLELKFWPYWGIGPVTFKPLHIQFLPELKGINTPLEIIRKFVAWNIILAFAVASLVLAFIIIKIGGFVRRLLIPEERIKMLRNLSIWLIIFAVCCTVFYFGVVVR